MTLIGFLRLFIKKLPWLVLFPTLIAVLVVYLTKNITREYQSTTILYTGLASGYNIGDEDTRIDYFAVNNAFDNLIATVKSRETIEETSLRLLAQHLMQPRPEYTVLNEKSFKELHEIVPDSFIKRVVVPGNLDSTYANLYRERISSSKNRIAYLINNSANSHYSVTGILGRLIVQRKGNSDFLELSFKSEDPAVCMHTLRFLIEVFKNRYKSVKGSENQNVVRYFEEQLRKALLSLRSAEDKLKNFGVNNRIINYNEQSKFIAESKEDMTTDYYKEVMRFGAAKAAVERLEKRMDERGTVIGNNRELLEKRRLLGIAQRRLANAEVYGSPAEEIEKLQNEVNVLSEEIRILAKEYMKLNYTVESVPQKDLLSEWLTKVLEYEESAARISVFDRRLKEYDKIYDDFAPLGSEVTRLTREVDVAEKEYLSILHGLNLAKLRQKNLEMANSLTTMDEPFFPLVPLASKRLILVIAAFLAGFVLLLAFFVGNEMLDNAVRTPEKAVKASGLPLAGALPSARKMRKAKGAEKFEHALTEQLVTSVTIALRETEKVSTYYQINIFSARQAEGKTWLAQRLANRFAQIGKVLYLYPEDSPLGTVEMAENVTAVPYKVTGAFVDTHGVQQLLEGTGHTTFEYAYIFLEIPHLSQNSVPYDLVAQAHVSLLVMNAEKVWARAYERANILYQKAVKNKVLLVLNYVTPEMLEGVYGEVPKRRSPLRRLIKRVVSMGAT